MASPSGYDRNFLTEPDDAFKCFICLHVAKDPRHHEECGKLFCNECIEKYGKDKPCPNCKETGVQFHKDHRSKLSVSILLIQGSFQESSLYRGQMQATI